MELHQIGLHVVHLAAITLDAAVDFIEKTFGHAVQLVHHRAALFLFARSDAVVHRRHFQCLLEHTQIGQHTQIMQAEIGGHHRLVVNTNQGHEVFGSSHTPSGRVAFSVFSTEEFGKYSH